MAKGGGAEIGANKKRGKGLKIMAIVDRHDLQLSVSTHAANHHECVGSALFRLLHDRGQAREPHRRSRLRQRSTGWQLHRDGMEMIAPHRSNRSKAADAGRAANSDDTPGKVAGKTLLRLDPVATPHTCALEVLPPELPRLRPTRLPRHPPLGDFEIGSRHPHRLRRLAHSSERSNRQTRQ